MANAVIDQVVDGVVSLIQSAWNPSAPDSVSAVDLPYEVLAEIPAGTTVQVFAGRYVDNGAVDRGPEFDMEYTITILAFSLYTPQGDPTQAAARAFRAFVEQKIFDVIKDPKSVRITVTKASGATASLWPLRVDEVVSYDPEKLKYDKLFWSSVTVTFQGVTPF